MRHLNPPVQPAPVVLNAAQREAARSSPGVTLVQGGPGSGKTTALIEAVATRVEEGASLSEIAVLAGSRNAAQGLRRAIIGRLRKAQTQPVVTTVHGLALGILRQLQPIGQEPWILLRAPTQEERIRDLLRASTVPWPAAVQGALGTAVFARQMRELLARVRQRSWDEEDLRVLAQEREDPLLRATAEFLDEYLTVGDLAHTLDYAELVYRCRLLLCDDEVAGAVRSRFRAVIVDDVHDLDQAQTSLLLDLASAGVPLLVFGDPSQSVSTFRGADARGMFALLDIEPSRTVALHASARHAKAVLSSLQHLRLRIAQRVDTPELVGARSEEGEVRVSIYGSGMQEAAWLADGIRAAFADGAEWGDVAVITRAGRAQLVPFAHELSRRGIPVEFVADDLIIAEDDAVQVLLLALEVAANGGEASNEQAERLVLSDCTGMDALDLRRARRQLGEGAWWPLLGSLDDRSEWAKAGQLVRAVREAAVQLASGAAVDAVLWSIWDATNWPERLRQRALSGNRTANRHLDALVELFERAGREPVGCGIGGAKALLRVLQSEEISADTARESTLRGVGVQLTTAHRAKGQEWEHVFVVGVQEGRWPKATPGDQLLDPSRLLDGVPTSVSEHIQQERRLFALACSRAATKLYVSAVQSQDETPSRFITELGVEPQVVSGEPSLPMTMAALVGELRAVAADPLSSATMRRGAAAQLAKLASSGNVAAHPDTWWGRRSPGPTPVEQAPVYISGSKLEDMLRCPRRYLLGRRAKAERPRDLAAALGTLIHELAQEAQSKGLTRDQLLIRLGERWETLKFATPWQEHAEREAAVAMLTGFSNWQEAQRSTLLAVEQKFEVQVAVGDTSVVLHGQVDRLELVTAQESPRLRIVDLKSIKVRPSGPEVARNVQLGLYQLATSAGAFDKLAPGVREVESPGLLLLRHQRQGLPILAEQSTLAVASAFDDEPLVVGPTWMHDRIYHVAELLQQGTFPAIPSRACSNCAFSNGCPAGKDAQ